MPVLLLFDYLKSHYFSLSNEVEELKMKLDRQCIDVHFDEDYLRENPEEESYLIRILRVNNQIRADNQRLK